MNKNISVQNKTDSLTPNRVKVSIVIVSWNVKDLLQKCLKSVFASIGGCELEVFVVDNASKDDGLEMIRNNFPQVNLIVNDKNVGFGRANNQGIKKAKGDYILVLNPDTELEPDTLEKSINFMEQNPACGIMGCKMVFADGNLQPSVRRFPTLLPIVLMLFKLAKVFKFKSVERYLATDFDYTKTQVVDQVMGAYMFIKKEVIDRVGAFDERFFIWFEEVDLCRRVKDAGLKVMYSVNTQIVHHKGKSFDQQRVVSKQWRFFQSAFKYFFKHGLNN